MMHQLLFLAVCFIAATNAILPTPYGLVPHDHYSSPQPDLLWSGASFAWPCPSTKALYKSSGKYISKNAIATRGQIHQEKVYMALPRLKAGIPATLVSTPLKHGGCQTTLTPFPCWSMQEEGNCHALQSVVDIVLDNNDVLWALDVGVTSSLDNPVRKCPPKIMAFSVTTGKVLKSILLDGLATQKSRLQYLVVDYAADNRCYVYVSDASSGSIIVYDVEAGRGYRVVLPKAIAMGSSKRDVLYLALVRKSCGSTVLYFTYLRSKRLFSIKTEYLRKGYAQGRLTDVGVKPNKMVIIGTDNGSSIFFRYEGQAEVYRWDTNTCFKAENFRPVYRSQTCQLATHVMPDYKRGRMRVLSSTFLDYINDTVGCGAEQHLSIMQGCW